MSDNGMLKALALASQLGFAVAGPLVVFIAGGVWADSQFGTKPWLFFLGLVLGIVSAGAALYQLAVAMPAKRSKQRPPGQSGSTGISAGHDGTSRANKERDS